MSGDTFWSVMDEILDRIESEKPDTFNGVRDILDHPVQRAYAGTYTNDASFFGGSGGDRSLWSALGRAGWYMIWSEASYNYAVTHPNTGEVLTYCEGDVHRVTLDRLCDFLKGYAPGESSEVRANWATVNRSRLAQEGVFL